MSATVIGGALGQWPLGKLSDRLDRRKVLLGACLAAAVIGLAIRVLYPTLGSGVLILSMLWGMSAFPLYSICAAHMNDHVEGGGFVEASSGLLLTFAAGAIVGPIIVSPFMMFITPYSLFGWTAFFQIALAVFIVYRMRIREAVPEAQRGSFVDALNEIQTVLPIPISTTDDKATAATDELSPAATDEC
jgi:MFS family permease